MGRMLIKRKGPAKSTKRKAPISTKKAVPPKKKLLEEEEISSDEDFSGAEDRLPEYSDEEYEDVQGKAHRQAKELLKSLEIEAKDEETGEIDNEAIAHRLQEDALAKINRLHRQIADVVNCYESWNSQISFTPHRFSVVAAALCPERKYIISCGKDGSIVKYDIDNKQIVCRIQYFRKNPDNHKGGVTALAISPDGKWLVSGGADNVVKVWDFSTFRLVHNFAGHRGPVTALTFRLGSSAELFSASKDRTVKAWNLDQFGYVDTSYGHQDCVNDIDMLSKERVLSVGSHDKTARFWKIDTESQLIFNGHKHAISIDTCSMINDDHFVTGSADGSINVWSAFKKKPIATVKEAHDCTDGRANWIVSIAAAKFTDLIASGSCDGWIRFWKISTDYKTVKPVGKLLQKGFINDLRFTNDEFALIAAVGQEHKCGRWWKLPEGRNGVILVNLKFKDKKDSSDEWVESSDDDLDLRSFGVVAD